jgi:hypothetical protein
MVHALYDRLSGATDQQLRDQSHLDGRVVQVFAAASVVMGLTGLSATTAPSNPTAVALLLLFALVAYVADAVLAGLALSTRGSDSRRFGPSLWETDWNEPPEQVRSALIARVKPAYEEARGVLSRKAHLLGAGIVATGIEVAFVTAAVIVRVVGT